MIYKYRKQHMINSILYVYDEQEPCKCVLLNIYMYIYIKRIADFWRFMLASVHPAAALR